MLLTEASTLVTALYHSDTPSCTLSASSASRPVDARKCCSHLHFTHSRTRTLSLQRSLFDRPVPRLAQCQEQEGMAARQLLAQQRSRGDEQLGRGTSIEPALRLLGWGIVRQAETLCCLTSARVPLTSSRARGDRRMEWGSTYASSSPEARRSCPAAASSWVAGEALGSVDAAAAVLLAPRLSPVSQCEECSLASSSIVTRKDASSMLPTAVPSAQQCLHQHASEMEASTTLSARTAGCTVAVSRDASGAISFGAVSVAIAIAFAQVCESFLGR
jgi:hypothetical protein